MTHKKIISLLPAATEIIVALGLGDNLVGRSHKCNYPESIHHLPVCTSSNLDQGNSSQGIDNQLKDILSDGLSIYSLNKNMIRELAPDVIITQDQCAVCAVSLNDVEAAMREFTDKNVELISLKPASLQDIFGDIRRMGSFFSVSDRAEALIEEMEERIDIIRHKLKFIENKPKVVCIEWIQPLMTAGNWNPGLIHIAGGNPVLSKEGEHSPYIGFDQIREENPDIIVIMPCGFSMPRTLQEINLLLEMEGWSELSAVQNNRIYIADGDHYFNRPGPRITDSIEILAEIINPKQFVFGYEGEGWIKFNV
ncbi:cobalamin-binding protein [Daejeonella oryzae]|uniref:cobalamin-binding protein n=1 Tax=Daejeonella oryzae TaxID=1122943 RepID=UPI000414FCCF|nr:cobalamin-binding protein [Daejeonella oryzae]